MTKRILTLLFFVIVLKSASAQDKSNRGKEFWLAYGFDYTFFNEAPINSQELAIYISTELPAIVTISITNSSYSQTLNIPANTVDATILIPKSGANDARTLTDGLQNRGIHIVSNVPVAAYAHVYANQVSGATMLMPIETYGYLYHSINYYQTTSQSNPGDWYSWFYVIASEDNTRLDITPSDSTKNGWLPNQTYTLNLNKGESYHVFGKAVFGVDASRASKDMTGSKIVSVVGGDGNCHPVATFSGSGGIRLCRGDGGEFMQQQVFPAQAWGTRYLTYHTINNSNTDILETNRNIYRICVADPTTVVKKNGLVMTGLIRNFFYEYMDSTGGQYIESDKPILVSQYMVNKNQCWNFPTTSPSPPSYGDPEMFYLSPIEQGQKSVLFYTSRKSTIDYVYANIHLPTAAVGSLRVDGNVLPASQVIPHPNFPSYSVALVRFVGAANQHTVVADSAFTGTTYGLGNYESYGYNFGTNINNLNNYSALQNSLSSLGTYDTSTCPNTPVRLFIKLAYPATSIHWKLSQVTGISPNVDSIIATPILVNTENINGRTYYIYSLQQDFIFANTGIYNIPISYTTPAIANCNQTEIATLRVVVKAGPKADFTTNNTLCLQDTVRFTGTPIPNGFNLINHTYFFDDATTSNGINAVKRFAIGGNHSVKYRIVADNGCVADTTKIISLLGSPIPKFGANSNVCSSDSVYITDTSSVATGTITNWYWSFGDGQTANKTNGNPFYHKYTGAGPFNLKLVVTGSNGCKSDTLTKVINLIPTPLAKFGFDKNVCLGNAIVFSDSSYLTSSAIATWNWNFGNSISAIKTNSTPFSYTYPAAGAFTVSLVAVGTNGCKSDTFKLPVAVTTKPSANFTFLGKPCKDSIFTFTSSTLFNASIPTVWYWNYGDAISSTITSTNIVTHAYNLASSITVKHLVTFGGCVSDTSFLTIPIINPNPTVNFNITSTIFCENIPINFIGNASADATIWQWNFGNGLGNNTPPFDRIYNNPYNGNVKLKVLTAEGCGSVEVVKPLTIAAAPNVNAGPDLYLKIGTTKTINASISNASNYNFLWTPATNLSNSNLLTPITNTIVPIEYKIKATDKINGCVGYDSMQVKSYSTIYVPNVFTPNGDGKNDKWIIPALEAYPNCTVVVYNRYGQKIFESIGYKTPWDGRFKNIQQPLGAYVYTINPGDGVLKMIEGTVLIIK
ncbi:MAG: PKD domain-containing protein [Ferruginibacter sp.]|nr:PKD domain-containing protein [Ferruginibacter sp.]